MKVSLTILLVIINIFSSACSTTKILQRPYISGLSGPQDFIHESINEMLWAEDEIKKDIFFLPGNYPINIILDFVPLSSELHGIIRLDEPNHGTADISPLRCIISINSEAFKDLKLFKVVLFHELGHCLGLDDEEKDQSLVMSDSVTDETLNSQYNNIPEFLKILDKITPFGQKR